MSDERISDAELAVYERDSSNYAARLLRSGAEIYAWKIVDKLVAALRAARKPSPELKALLFCADMHEKCAERQHEWSGPSQAFFHAMREYRKATVQKTPSAVWKVGPHKGEPIERTPDGQINNCAAANGASAAECQMCGGRCPDISEESK
jgi:hypothetical protein